MADHAHLLGDDVELLAGFNADFLQGSAVVWAGPLGLWQLMGKRSINPVLPMNN